MIRTLILGLLLCVVAVCVVPPRASGPELGSGLHRYAWVPDWSERPAEGELGNTHGDVVVDRTGRVYVNTDTDRAVLVYDADGRLLSSWGDDLTGGLHGMCLFEEQGQERLFLAHIGRHEILKTTLDGEVLWRAGVPLQSGHYESADQYRPTDVAVAPDGRFFVADGYGRHVVHRYAADGTWLGSFGGHGKAPGQFNTPHGVLVDTRHAEPRLLVADRENARLQAFDLDGRLLGVVEGMLRRPCKVRLAGDDLVIPDLAGRVTILDGDDRLLTHLGDNPDPALRAVNGVPRESWRPGEFLAPHGAGWDADGNLYVVDWNFLGRVTRLQRLR